MRAYRVALLIGILAGFVGCPDSSSPSGSDVDDLGATDVAFDVADVPILPDGAEMCDSDDDCLDGMVCDPDLNYCRPCRTNPECGDDNRCIDGVCQTAQVCSEDDPCPSPLVCDGATGVCVRCLVDQDCLDGYSCEDKVCVKDCVPDCYGRECGPDGCGSVCGTCPANWTCSAEGVCVEGATLPCGQIYECMLMKSVMPADSAPSCAEMGSPGEKAEFEALIACAEEVCGPIEQWNGYECLITDAVQGDCQELYKQCVQCTPDCAGRECGTDGCGGVCGVCGTGETCEWTSNGYRCEGTCDPQCFTPDGQALECGPDGCGGVCGACEDGWDCVDGMCGQSLSCDQAVECLKDCGNELTEECWNDCTPTNNVVEREKFMLVHECTWNMCATNHASIPLNCFLQAVNQFCAGEYADCQNCMPACWGLECGSDGCGGSCGTCDPNVDTCVNGRCVSLCVPSCTGLECGSDGCGGICGVCSGDEKCVNGRCTDDCKPQCVSENGVALECGPDRCGGSCGTCSSDEKCVSGQCVGSCVPDCAGLECGSDGCGGLCGVCASGYFCADGRCVNSCIPNCVSADGQSRECGPDGCGGVCGTCAYGEKCVNGACVGTCKPDCIGKECGPDGCGSVCGTCSSDETCSGGLCVGGCEPDCLARQCGSDGCGGSCGTCPTGYSCTYAGKCAPWCTPDCSEIECGSDGCGGYCGWCGADENCVDGQCELYVDCNDILTCIWECPNGDTVCNQGCYKAGSVDAQRQYLEVVLCIQAECGPVVESSCTSTALAGPCKALYYACVDCTPNCDGRECGSDGCGGLCGTCADGAQCDPFGQCPCEPYCVNRQCGTDGCGGSCGECAGGLVCSSSGKCLCVPRCDNRECGTDGCGGSCGLCPAGSPCESGTCAQSCTPFCENRMCGDDGCGGSCGECPQGLACDANMGLCVGFQHDGCEPVDVPGCMGCECEACVCEQDPYCCEVVWDENCAKMCWTCGGCGCEPSCMTDWGQIKECGSNGCGGSCGECPADMVCNSSGMCERDQGGMSCSEMIDCSLRCLVNGFTDPTCITECMGDGSDESQQLFMDLMQCVLGVCGMPDESCIWQAVYGPCEEQYHQCLAD